MNVTTTDINETRKKLLVEAPADEIAEKEKKITREFSRHAKVPGFRAGKAPESMLRSRYAKQIAEELKRQLVSDAYRQAVDESGFSVYNVVSVGDIDPKPGEGAAIEIVVDIMPDFELPEYKGIETTALPPEPTAEEIEKTIERVRGERAQFKVVEREAQKGDYVKVSYTGTVDGAPIAELAEGKPIWGTQENTWEEAGAEGQNRFGVPAIIDGVIGMKAGDKKEALENPFPADFEIPELAGKTGLYDLEIHEVRQREMPELNEEFFKSLGVENEEGMREQVSNDIAAQKKQASMEMQRNQIVETLNDRIEFPVPDSAVESETQAVLARVMQENMRRGVPEEEFEKHKQELYENSRRAAIKQVKIDTIIERIAEKEEISVEETDIQRAIMMQAMQTRQKPQQLVKELEKDRGRVQALQKSILINKTLDFLVEQAKVTVKEGSEA